MGNDYKFLMVAERGHRSRGIGKGKGCAIVKPESGVKQNGECTGQIEETRQSKCASEANDHEEEKCDADVVCETFDLYGDTDVTNENLMAKLEVLTNMVSTLMNLMMDRDRAKSVSASEEWKAHLDLKRLHKFEKTLETHAEDAPCEMMSLQEDLAAAISAKSFVRGRVKSWFPEKGFGFATLAERVVFIHVSAIRRVNVLKLGSDVVLKVMVDESREGEKFKAMEAWSMQDWKAEQSLLAAAAAANNMRRAAELSVKLATKSAHAGEMAITESQAAWLAKPPGLDAAFEGEQQAKEPSTPLGRAKEEIPAATSFETPIKNELPGSPPAELLQPDPQEVLKSGSQLIRDGYGFQSARPSRGDRQGKGGRGPPTFPWTSKASKRQQELQQQLQREQQNLQVQEEKRIELAWVLEKMDALMDTHDPRWKPEIMRRFRSGSYADRAMDTYQKFCQKYGEEAEVFQRSPKILDKTCDSSECSGTGVPPTTGEHEEGEQYEQQVDGVGTLEVKTEGELRSQSSQIESVQREQSPITLSCYSLDQCFGCLQAKDDLCSKATLDTMSKIQEPSQDAFVQPVIQEFAAIRESAQEIQRESDEVSILSFGNSDESRKPAIVLPIDAVSVGSVCALTARQRSHCDEFVKQHGLDDGVKGRLLKLRPEQLSEALSTYIGPRVKNPSGYMTTIVRRIIRRDPEQNRHDEETWHGNEEWSEEQHEYNDEEYWSAGEYWQDLERIATMRLCVKMANGQVKPMPTTRRLGLRVAYGKVMRSTRMMALRLRIANCKMKPTTRMMALGLGIANCKMKPTTRMIALGMLMVIGKEIRATATMPVNGRILKTIGNEHSSSNQTWNPQCIVLRCAINVQLLRMQPRHEHAPSEGE